MSSVSEEIELLDRVLLRFGCADSDEKLEATIGRFLTPVILKISSPNDNVRAKVVEVLTHIKRRITSRPKVQIPVDALLDQYKESRSSFLQNFAIIFITLGFPRLPLENQCLLAGKLIGCDDKQETYQNKLFMLLLPILNDFKIPDDPAQRKQLLQLEDKPAIRSNFLNLLQDVLLLPYGVTQEHGLPPGMSPYSFKRVIINNWKAEDLEKIKQGILRFICSGIFNDNEIFILLVLASADTRFSVATPAIAELNKVCTVLDFSDPQTTGQLYTLFNGINSQTAEHKTTPCCSRVRQKLLQYIIKCHGKGINVTKGIQVIFESLFGGNSSQKCKVLALKFAENFIREVPEEIVFRLSKVLLTGFMKVCDSDTNESLDVQIAGFSALAQLSRTCPSVINQDLKIVLTYFNQLANSPVNLQTSIREALVAMAPAFVGKETMNIEMSSTDTNAGVVLNGQQHLLLAMLSDNAISKVNVVQNVTSVFLTTCYPEYYSPARFLLLLIAGQRNSLSENITNYLYGASKKDHINYNNLISIEYVMDKSVDGNLSLEQGILILPGFKTMMHYVDNMSKKQLNKGSHVLVGRTKLSFDLDTYEEILHYLRVCLWYSAGIISVPGNEKHTYKLQEYIQENYNANDDNELYQYLHFVQCSVEAKRTESNLLCLFDLLNASPDLLSSNGIHLLEPLAESLKDASETMRIHVAQVYGILLAYGFNDAEFNAKISAFITSLPQKSLEYKHGCILVLGHAFSRKLHKLAEKKTIQNYGKWIQFVESVKLISKMLCDTQWLLVSAAVKCISLIGKTVVIPNVEIEVQMSKANYNNEDNNDDEMLDFEIGTTKVLIFRVIFNLLRSTSKRAKIREESAKCLGYLAIGDGEFFTKRNLDTFLSLIKVKKDIALDIAMSEAIVSTLNGYDVNSHNTTTSFENAFCDNAKFISFLDALIRLVSEPDPHVRQSCSVWLLAVVKHCKHRPAILNNKLLIQYAFIELLSDDSEFVQDVASRGLGLVHAMSDVQSQNDLANSLLNQLIGGKRNVNKVCDDTELFAEGMLGKTPTGGNITTYKELCSLASDLNQPDMVYQFMQLANHNASWTSKLGAAFGLKSLSVDSKVKMQSYLGKIIPRLYRYKYDPTPKIQNSMISIWDSVVTEPKQMIEQYYWEILREILDNLTCNEWRVRIACCLAVRDLLKRANGLRLRIDDAKLQRKAQSGNHVAIEVDDVPEPELKELWIQLFRVMDDIHEGTRLTAQGTTTFLSKLCVNAASLDHGKSSIAVTSSILPLLLDEGIMHTVPEIRKISIMTISEMIDSSGELIAPYLSSLIPCLLKATGELESTKLSYLSTRLGSDVDAQESMDTIRAEAIKAHITTDTITKCIRFIDILTLTDMTSAVIELIKTTVSLGTKIACAHFVCEVSIRLGKEMTPLVSKYLAACFAGLKDRNSTVRKYYASSIGHLVGIAKEQSILNLCIKLDELYMQNPANRSIPLTIQSINKRHHDLLKDYWSCVLPLVFFAMHEEKGEENKSNIALWKELWNEISPGDAGIRMNLNVIIPKLEKSLADSSLLRRIQAANAIVTVATRLKTTIEEVNRVHLISLILTVLQGRMFQGKECMLQALSALCVGLNKQHEICSRIIDVTMRECRKEAVEYRTQALSALGDILEELEIDRFEEVYNMVWYLLDKNVIHKTHVLNDEYAENEKDLTADERSKRAQILDKLKENTCDVLGKAWPKYSLETQRKYQQQFAERCSLCLKDSTRLVQVSLMRALLKFVERLTVLGNYENELMASNKEKKVKVCKYEMEERDTIVQKICLEVLSAVTYSAGLPHTGLKKESLNIILMLIKRLSDVDDTRNLALVNNAFNNNMPEYQKDFSPEIRCRIKDIEEKLSKYSFYMR